MSPAVIIALLAFCVTFVAQAAVIFVWGGSMSQRVKALEDDMKTLKDLPVQVATLGVRMDGVIEQLKDLNASIRWMREPSPPYQPQSSRRPVTDKDNGR